VLVHLERLCFPLRYLPHLYRGTISSTAVIRCIKLHPALTLLHLAPRVTRRWTTRERISVSAAAWEKGAARKMYLAGERSLLTRCFPISAEPFALLAVTEYWDSEDEELDD
jgi:hypothetical protein